MTLKTELMSAGIAGAAANRIGQDVGNTGLTATGTTQGGALLLTSSMSVFTTVGASSGALLPLASGKATFVVVNNGANTLSLYPSGSETINGGSASTAISIPATKSAMLVGNSQSWGAVISA